MAKQKRAAPDMEEAQGPSQIPQPVQDLVSGEITPKGPLMEHLSMMGNALSKVLLTVARGGETDEDLEGFDHDELDMAAAIIAHHDHGGAFDDDDVGSSHNHMQAPHPIVDGPRSEGDNPILELFRRNRGPLSEQRSVQILQDAFGSYKQMSAGDVRVLDTAGLKAAWQEIYGGTQYDWEVWVKPKGGLNGFAHDGVNYINSDSANIGTVPHEMLHSNTAPDYFRVCGSPFTEGSTDFMKQIALKKAGLRSPNSYPEQLKCVEAFIASGQSEDQLINAYLNGGAQQIVADWVDDHCQGSWDDVKTDMEAGDFAAARVKLERAA